MSASVMTAPQARPVSSAPSLINSLRAEVTKLLSLRSTLVYAILLTGSLYGPVTLVVLFGEDNVGLDWPTMVFGYPIFQLIAIIFAASFTAGDIRNHLHAEAFLTQAGRWQWVIAKIIVTSVLTTVLYLVGVLLSLGLGAALGGNLILGADQQYFYVSLIGSVLFAAMTVGLSCLIRGQVASVAVPVTWVLVLDGMIGLAAEHLDFLRPLAAIAPNQRLNQLLIGGTGPDADPLGLGLGTAVCYLILIGWFVVLTAVGLWRNQRTDVR